MGDDIILPVDDHGAAGAGSGVPGDELSPEAALEVRPATDLLIEGAGDRAFFDLAVPHLDSTNRQGLDHSPLPVAAITIDEGSRKLDRECLARLGIGGGGVEGDIQIEVVAGDELPSRRGDRSAVLQHMGERDGIEDDVGVFLGPGLSISVEQPRRQGDDNSDAPPRR